MEIEEREKRNAVAHAIIEIIGNLNPHIRDAPDYRHKLWDHLYIMSDFKLDVDGPYPTPQRETFESEPELIKYPVKSARSRHYGQILRRLIKKVNTLEADDPERPELVVNIANQMKKAYLNWNKDTVQDEQIWKDLFELSDGKIERPDEEAVLANAQSLTSGMQQYKDRNSRNRNNKQRNRSRNPKGPKKKFRKPTN